MGSNPQFTYKLLLKSSLYVPTASQVFTLPTNCFSSLRLRANCLSSLHFTYKLLLKSSLYVQTSSQVLTLRTNCFSSLHFTYKLLLKSSLYVTNFCRAPNPASLSGFRRARGKNSTYGENQRSRGTSIFLMILGCRG